MRYACAIAALSISTGTTHSLNPGKIAVKVINHYGDEVLKVYEVN
jgi:hypothetical protein